MAQLRTKQIKDFNAEVQALIDNDSDQNAGLIDALEASVDSLEAVAGGSVTSDLAASVDSLEAIASTAIDERGYLDASVDSLETVASTAIDERGYLVNSVDSLETRVSDAEVDISDNANTLAAFATRTDASIDSLELVDASQNNSIDSIETAISAILDIPGTDLDQMSEVVAYVNSLDVLQGGELTTGLATVNASIDSLEVAEDNAIASIDSLEVALGGEILSTNADVSALQDSVDSLEAATGGNTSALEASVDSLETVDSIQNLSIDSLEVALGGEILSTNADVSALQDSVDSLEAVDAALSLELTGNAAYVKQGGIPTSPTEFTVALPVRYGAADDLHVFINGLEIHPSGITIIQPGVNEYEGAPTVSTTEGYSTGDGTNFTLTGLGYSLEPSDHVHVTGIRQ